MRSSNPVLSDRGFARIKSGVLGNRDVDSRDLNTIESRPTSAPMSIDDVVIKTAGIFAVLVAVGAFAWQANNPGLALIGLFGGFILAMVNTFSKKVRPGAVIAYAAFQGLALGTLSRYYENYNPGIVSQAILGTLAAFAGVLFMYRSGKLRATQRFTRTLIGAAIGYFVLGLFSLIGSMFGLGNGYGLYGVTGISLLLAVAGVALASFFLVLDFDQIQRGVNAGVPNQEAWRAGFGLMVTIIWLYLEVLRLLSILRNDR